MVIAVFRISVALRWYVIVLGLPGGVCSLILELGVVNHKTRLEIANWCHRQVLLRCIWGPLWVQCRCQVATIGGEMVASLYSSSLYISEVGSNAYCNDRCHPLMWHIYRSGATPVVPVNFHHLVINSLHSLLHPSIEPPSAYSLLILFGVVSKQMCISGHAHVYNVRNLKCIDVLSHLYLHLLHQTAYLNKYTTHWPTTSF